MSGYRNIELGSKFLMQDQIDYKTNRIISLNICETKDIRMVLFSFYKDEDISEEVTQDYEQYSIIEGEATITLEGKKFSLCKNDTIIVPPDKTHSIYAITNCKILQTSFNVND